MTEAVKELDLVDKEIFVQILLMWNLTLLSADKHARSLRYWQHFLICEFKDLGWTMW